MAGVVEMIAVFILFIAIFFFILWASIPPKMNQESSDDYSIHIFDSFIRDGVQELPPEYNVDKIPCDKHPNVDHWTLDKSLNMWRCFYCYANKERRKKELTAKKWRKAGP